MIDCVIFMFLIQNTRFDAETLSIVMTPDRQYWVATIFIKFRLLRVSYEWESFLMKGILSMYHTCGNDLPVALINVRHVIISK